jgi:hypothetical protein
VSADHLSPETIKSLAETQLNVNRSREGGGFATGFFGALGPAVKTMKGIYPSRDEADALQADLPQTAHLQHTP